MVRTFKRYFILLPIGIIFVPVFALALWMSPSELYKSFFEHLRSGEAFGAFDE